MRGRGGGWARDWSGRFKSRCAMGAHRQGLLVAAHSPAPAVAPARTPASGAGFKLRAAQLPSGHVLPLLRLAPGPCAGSGAGLCLCLCLLPGGRGTLSTAVVVVPTPAPAAVGAGASGHVLPSLLRPLLHLAHGWPRAPRVGSGDGICLLRAGRGAFPCHASAPPPNPPNPPPRVCAMPTHHP